jgi:hypothetical protein
MDAILLGSSHSRYQVWDLHRVGPIIRTAGTATQPEFFLTRIHFSDSSSRNSFLLISLAK